MFPLDLRFADNVSIKNHHQPDPHKHSTSRAGSSQPSLGPVSWPPHIQTEALRRALGSAKDIATADDLIFLETWEASSVPGIAATLRASQIRRANPLLAAEIRAELRAGTPATA